MIKKALIMIGLPGSGKSTILKDHKWLTSHINEGVVTILSTDNYIEAKAKEVGSTYSDMFTAYVKEAEHNLKDRLNTAIDQGNHIIWDQTNLRKTKRSMIINSIPSDYHKVAVIFNVPFEVIVERVKLRGEATGKIIGYNILKSMWDSRDEVTLDEGFHEYIIISNGIEE